MTRSDRHASAALAALIMLQAVMLGALFTATVPHPPETIALFGIGPFVGASLAFAVAALVLGPAGSAVGRLCSLAAGLGALMSYGPQKILDAQFPLIWPTVVTGWAAILVLFWALYAGWRARNAG